MLWTNGKKIEASRLEWIRRNQKSIRAEKYKGLMDSASSDDPVIVSMKIILPTKVCGSPHCILKHFMAAWLLLAKPEQFINFMCNVPNGLKLNQL